MYLLKTPTVLDPATNLAIEEYAVRNLDINNDYLYIYQNNPSLIIGKNQNPFEEINVSLVLKEDIEIVRRISGGGAVYHGPGNINFCYITRSTRENFNNYKNFLKPIVDYLNKLKVAAEINKRNDLVIHGKKISGNAQFTSRNKMLSHGTLLFDADLKTLEQALIPKKVNLQSKSTKSVKSTVTNIRSHIKELLTSEQFKNQLTDCLLTAKGLQGEIEFTVDEWTQINRLIKNKYSSWKWNWGRTPEFDIHVTFGRHNKSKTLFTIKEGIIKSFQTEANQHHKEIFESLRGIRYWKKDIELSLKKNCSKLKEREKKLIANCIFPF